jgi:hypothetical protein
MSLASNEGDIAIKGKKVEHAEAGVDGAGYGYVLIVFTDTTVLEISERKQTGEIGYDLSLGK